MQPVISLVITVYHRERYLKAAIKSALAQTRPNLSQSLLPTVKVLAVSNLALILSLLPITVKAQSITPAADGTGTVVNTQGNNINISGGTLSGDQANLFHSFSKFGLDANQTANFLSQPSIQNILGRVTGGQASFINGLIRVTGGNSNLYLINPAGIVFGNNASLNVPASFTATTSDRIGFSNGWFNAIGTNNYNALIGSPNSFAFDSSVTSAILNQGNLAVPYGNNLSLFGGTVVSTGTLSAPGGNITVATVPGSSLLKLTIPGNPLSLEIQPLNSTTTNNSTTNSLPALLTGGGGDNASQVQVNSNGEVQLTGSGLKVENGDVVVTNAEAKNITLAANQNLTLPESQLLTTGNLNLLAQNTVIIRDSVAKNFSAIAGGNLTIKGNQAIDVFAINHLDKTPFISGGDLTLISDGKISLDAHFSSAGKFSILTSQGQAGNFISLVDPIISSNQDVTFGNYTGPSLKVESRGSISAGEIVITGADTALPSSTAICGGSVSPNCVTDVQTLSSQPALILRAGETNILGTNFGVAPIVFNEVGGPSFPGNVNVTGNISFSGDGGPVIISATGNITTQNIDTSNFDGSGSVNLTAGGNITTQNIDTSSFQPSGLVQLAAGGSITTNDINTSFANEIDGASGQVRLISGNSITSGNINTSAEGFGSDAIAGAVTLNATSTPFGSNITFNSINAQATSDTGTGQGGNVSILANGVVRGTGLIPLIEVISNDTINSSGTTQSGTITIQHDGGPNNLPFIVGNPSINGTIGVINTGNTTITPTSTVNIFPVLPNGGIAVGTPNGISIISVNNLPTVTANSLPNTQQNQSVTFTFGSLNPLTTDANNDNRTIIFDAISSGNLTFQNGTPITSGTVLNPGTVLVYTPPTGASGSIPAFTIRANDVVSSSAPQQISINVTQPPIIPPDIPPDIPPTIPPDNNPDLDDAPDPEILTKHPPRPPRPPLHGGFMPPKSEHGTKLAKIDEKFTDKVGKYLGGSPTPATTINEARQILVDIESAAGVKPALIYVSFVPGTIKAGLAPEENLLTQDNDLLELVVVTAKGEPIRQVVNVTRSQVLAASQKFTSLVTDPSLRRSYITPSKQLYQWLITPIISGLKERQINNLVFLMDTGLRSMPVAALYDGQKYLIETYSVGLMPSLSLTDTRYVDIRKAEVLGMGASQFPNQDPLPAVPTELTTITQKLWPGRSFLNEGFTLQNLKEQRRERPFGIIHLATHGEFRPGAPGNSYIQLWDTQLKMDQMRQLGWNKPPVELVVLSACRTALGNEEAELGFAGFAVQAGAKSALASLWYVSDEGTFGLMTEFYEQLRKAPIKAEALRRAQVGMLKGEVRLEDGKLKTPSGDFTLPPALIELGDKSLNHPYFWSAFTMIGNPW
ncbi:CHAT domain-containing protein [Nostoc sp. FACHB-152]|uniref:CHAT domain-containing protein n=1 Tax=unclassified Nostoc TaxID=2593658 RepID=UPI001689BD1F|nr:MULTISPECIES: CHAT domain-containing protein [unclassified Nostoc]MBD2449873.1 CHAT domain-containing protein [Nostoc sp. FACHB-152]MBD2471849.1 CHAT domain-containing protein [Nostoc sp. FACHB-145]